MQKYRNLIFLALILAVALFLRAYKFDTNYYFSGELGKELLYLRQFVLRSSLPLVGMPTSHEWLSYGPIYYWIMIPVFILWNGNPFILFWAAVTISILGLVLNYLVFKKIAGEKIAIFSTIIQAISPLLIWQTRTSKLHVFFWVIMPVFTYLLYLMWEKPSSAEASEGRGKWVFWAGLVFGFLFSFHFSQIPLLGVVVLLFWIKRKAYKISDWIKFSLGVLIPNITLVWQDKNLVVWLPYRILNVTEKDPGGTIRSLIEYFGRSILWNQELWIIGLITFVVIFAHYILQNKNKFKKDFLPFYLVSSISLMLIANILHGAPPVHYFLPIFTLVPVLYAAYFEKNTKFLILFTILLFGINFSSYFKFDKPNDFVLYTKQIETVDKLINDAKGREFSIKRIGPYDYFPENYSHNYKYLILWKGGKLVENANLIYTIDDTK